MTNGFRQSPLLEHKKQIRLHNMTRDERRRARVRTKAMAAAFEMREQIGRIKEPERGKSYKHINLLIFGPEPCRVAIKQAQREGLKLLGWRQKSVDGRVGLVVKYMRPL